MTAPALSLFLNKDQTCDVDFGCYEDLDLEDLEKELTTILANVKRGRKAAAALQAIKSGKAPKNSHGQAGLDIFYEAAFSLRYSPKATVDLEEISLPAFMGMIELLSKQSLEALYDSPKALKEAASLLEKRPINPKVYSRCCGFLFQREHTSWSSTFKEGTSLSRTSATTVLTLLV